MKPLADRLADKVSPEAITGCWLWTGATTALGYGVLGRGRRGDLIIKAHRASWLVHKGDIPQGMNVLHHCDTPSCVNPNHLFLGTLKDNARDCVRKNRNFIPDNRGERAKWAKLTKEQVREIKSRRETGISYAKRFGVSKSAIYEIWRGNNWASI